MKLTDEKFRDITNSSEFLHLSFLLGYMLGVLLKLSDEETLKEFLAIWIDDIRLYAEAFKPEITELTKKIGDKYEEAQN